MTNITAPRAAHPSLTRRKFLKATLPAAIGMGLAANAISQIASPQSSGYGGGAYGRGTLAATPQRLY